MNSEVIGTFEVTDHYVLKDRGAFVIGNILGGAIKVGGKVRLPDGVTSWTISGVEFIDNIAQRIYRNALVFRERPALEELQRSFPVGTQIEVFAAGDID